MAYVTLIYIDENTEKKTDNYGCYTMVRIFADVILVCVAIRNIGFRAAKLRRYKSANKRVW